MTALAALLAGSASAQSNKGAGVDVAASAERLTTYMTTELGLSTDQAQQVKAINVKYLEKTMVMREAKDQTVDGMDKTALLDARDLELKGVLTTEQYDKMMSAKGPRPAKTAAPAHPVD